MYIRNSRRASRIVAIILARFSIRYRRGISICPSLRHILISLSQKSFRIERNFSIKERNENENFPQRCTHVVCTIESFAQVLSKCLKNGCSIFYGLCISSFLKTVLRFGIHVSNLITRTKIFNVTTTFIFLCILVRERCKPSRSRIFWHPSRSFYIYS